MTVYRGLMGFLRATETPQDPKVMFVQFMDGRAAIVYSSQDPDDQDVVCCNNGLSFSDGAVVSYGSFDEKDVVWGQVVDLKQSQQIVNYWKYEALVKTSCQEKFPRSWAYMSEIGMDTSYAPHVIAHARQHGLTGKPGTWDEYILARMNQDVPYSGKIKPEHHREFHDQLKTIATEEDASMMTRQPTR